MTAATQTPCQRSWSSPAPPCSPVWPSVFWQPWPSPSTSPCRWPWQSAF
jgi:hypothetical protein